MKHKSLVEPELLVGKSSNSLAECRRRSARLLQTSTSNTNEEEELDIPPAKTCASTSAPTFVSLSTLDSSEIKSPGVVVETDDSIHNSACFTEIQVSSKSELSATSSFTNVSILTNGTATGTNCTAISSNSNSNSDKYAPIVKRRNQSSTSNRRSKRLTSARIEFNKKKRCRLFVKPSKTTLFTIPLCREEHQELHQAILKNEFAVSPNAAKMQSDQRSVGVDLDAISRKIAFLPSTLKILNTCPESHMFTYLYKATYGSDYHASLLQREQYDYDPNSKNASKNEWNESTCSARPRTRSLCREEEEKEHFRLTSSSTVPNYISSNFQTDITADMRSILVDWIIGVARELNLRHETTHSCIKLMDRGLQKIKMSVEAFHTYGCACLLIACKLDEVERRRAVDIAFFTDSACTTKEICDMEMKICLTLKFNLQTITSFHFLDRYLDVSNLFAGAGVVTSHDNDECAHSRTISVPRYCPKHHAMSLLIIDTALLIPALVDVKDSLIAAAALYLSRAIVGVRDKEGMVWNSQLTHHTGYNVHQLTDIVSLIHLYHRDMENNVCMKSIIKKYKSAAYHKVAYKTSILPQDLELP